TLALKGGYCLESRVPSQSMKGKPARMPWDLASDDESQDFIFSQIYAREKEARVQELLKPVCDKVEFGWMPHLFDPTFKNAVAGLGVDAVAQEVDKHCGPRVHFVPPNVATSKFNAENLQWSLNSGKSVEIGYKLVPLLSPTFR